MDTASQAVAIAANIALARQVYDIPEDPITHDPIDRCGARFAPPESYRLPAQKELELAHALAVTSKLKDESDYTSAVAIVEDPKRRKLQVLLAVNRATPEDGLHELEMSRVALERVLEIMSDVRNRNNEGMEDRILGAVVSACMPKILARMGLAPCRHNKTRMPLDGKLSQAVQAVNALLWQRQPPGAQEFRMYGSNVLHLIAAWRQFPDDIDRLVAVVKGLYDLNTAVPSLDRLMRELPPRSIVPSAAKSIAAVVSKTAYYVRVARTLYRIAKKYPVARRATVVPILLPDAAFGETPMPHPGTISRDHKIRSLCPGAPPATLQAIVRSLNSSSKAARAGESFEEIMHTSLTGRLHAEMQIIYHCTQPDVASVVLPPRAVCASKASCFLCNAFVSAHAGVYVPFSHGRLYTNWRLPNMEGLEIPEAAFVGRLENTVTWGLGLLSAYGHAPQRPEPAQSVVMDLALSVTTLGDGNYADEEEEDYVSEPEFEFDSYQQEEYAAELVADRPNDEAADIDEPQLLVAENEEEDDDEFGGAASGDPHFQEGVPVSLDASYHHHHHHHHHLLHHPHPYTAVNSAQRELANESAEVETAPTTPEPEQEEVAVAVKEEVDVAKSEFKHTTTYSEPSHQPSHQEDKVDDDTTPVPAAVDIAPTPQLVEEKAVEPVVIPAKRVAASDVPMPVPTPPTSSAVPYAVEQVQAIKSKVPETIEEVVPIVVAVVEKEEEEEEKKKKTEQQQQQQQPTTFSTAVEPTKDEPIKVVEELPAVKKTEVAVPAPAPAAPAPAAPAPAAIEESKVDAETAKEVVKETLPPAKVETVVPTPAVIPVAKEPEAVVPVKVEIPKVVIDAVATEGLVTPTTPAKTVPVTPVKATPVAPVKPNKAVLPAPVSGTESVATSIDGTPKKKSRLKTFFKSLKVKKEKK